MQEFSLKKGPLLAIRGSDTRHRALLLEVSAGAWIGFVFYDGINMHHGDSSCAPACLSAHVTSLTALTGRGDTYVKNVFEVTRAHQWQRVHRHEM